MGKVSKSTSKVGQGKTTVTQKTVKGKPKGVSGKATMKKTPGKG